MTFARWMNSTAGRIARIVAGLAMIGCGLLVTGGWPGVSIAMAGVVPLAAGTLDVCLLAPILSMPWSGRRIRAMR